MRLEPGREAMFLSETATKERQRLRVLFRIARLHSRSSIPLDFTRTSSPSGRSPRESKSIYSCCSPTASISCETWSYTSVKPIRNWIWCLVPSLIGAIDLQEFHARWSASASSSSRILGQSNEEEPHWAEEVVLAFSATGQGRDIVLRWPAGNLQFSRLDNFAANRVNYVALSCSR